MATYTNAHGHEPSGPDTSPVQTAFRRPTMKLARRPHYDVTRCQAADAAGQTSGHGMRCPHPPVCVMVENKPRADGSIASMCLCQAHHDRLLSDYGEDYGKITLLEKDGST